MICNLFDKFDPATQFVANTTYAVISSANIIIPCLRVGEFDDSSIDLPLSFSFEISTPIRCYNTVFQNTILV